MSEENPVLRKLFDEISAKAEAIKFTNIALYYVKVNQAIGVMRAAEAEAQRSVFKDKRVLPIHHGSEVIL